MQYEWLISLGDASDALFNVENSGPNAGQVILSGTISAAVDSYTINIRVRFSNRSFLVLFLLPLSTCPHSFFLCLSLLTSLFKAFRVVAEGSIVRRSQVGTVTMTIMVTDINNNMPVILNPVANPLNVIEVRHTIELALVHISSW